MYTDSNAIVGHAARVHASAGPAVSVLPVRVKEPPQVLQSARVDSRPSRTTACRWRRPALGCAAWPATWMEDSAQVPAICSAVSASDPLPADGEVGVPGASEQPAATRAAGRCGEGSMANVHDVRHDRSNRPAVPGRTRPATWRANWPEVSIAAPLCVTVPRKLTPGRPPSPTATGRAP